MVDGLQSSREKRKRKESSHIYQVMQEIGFGLTHEMMGNDVMDYLKDKGRQNPFLNGKPCNDWWLGFMQRWPNSSRENHNTFQPIVQWLSQKLPLMPGYQRSNQWLRRRGLKI